jgi:hypothetical protein
MASSYNMSKKKQRKTEAGEHKKVVSKHIDGEEQIHLLFQH